MLSANGRSSMLVRHRFSDIHRRQQHENIGLNHRYADMQQDEHDRESERNQREEHQGHQIAGEHIGVKTYGERKNSRQMTEDLNGKQQNRQQRFWAHEILYVAEAVRAHALEVIIEPGHKRATQRHRGSRGRRFKSGYDTQQTTQQNEYTQDRQVAHVALVAVANHLVALLGDEGIELLHQVLHLPRVVHRQARPHDNKKQNDQHKYH